jgi:hypothetical protein
MPLGGAKLQSRTPQISAPMGRGRLKFFLKTHCPPRGLSSETHGDWIKNGPWGIFLQNFGVLGPPLRILLPMKGYAVSENLVGFGDGPAMFLQNWTSSSPIGGFARAQNVRWSIFRHFLHFFETFSSKRRVGCRNFLQRVRWAYPTPKYCERKISENPPPGAGPRVRNVKKREKSNYDSMQKTLFRPSHSAYGVRGETSPPPPGKGWGGVPNPTTQPPTPSARAARRIFESRKIAHFRT